MRGKHTPGPWDFQRVRGCRDIGPKIGELRKKIDAVAATVGMANDIEDEANARLMSAAPDLLTALKAMQKAVSQLLPGLAHIAVEDYANINDAPILAAKAIAKAEPAASSQQPGASS